MKRNRIMNGRQYAHFMTKKVDMLLSIKEAIEKLATTRKFKFLQNSWKIPKGKPFTAAR